MIGGCDKLLGSGACALLHDDPGEAPPERARCRLLKGETCVKKLERRPEP